MKHLITTTAKDGGSVDNAGAIIDQLDVWTTAEKPKKSRGRGRGAKTKKSPHGVQKLRELILELAVRGKLVPQDPADEPASELLKKVAAEKSKLIKSKVIRKTKEPMAYDGGISPIPDSWIYTLLYDVGEIGPRIDAPDDTEASFVPMPLISEFYGVQVQSEARLWREIKSGFTHFAEGDVALAKITPCFQNTKSCVMVDLKNGIGAGTTELHVFRPIGEFVCPEYVLLFLKSPAFIREGIPKMTGSAGQKRITRDYFAGKPFPLPPTEEQHRIVAKVEELMALCDKLEQEQAESGEAHQQLVETLLGTLTQAENNDELEAAWQRMADHFDTLFTTEASMGQFKQTILQLAVMGKLVPQDPTDEPASELLNRKTKMKVKYTPFGIPRSWDWARVDEFAETRLGKMLDKAKNKGTPLRYLRNINVRWFDFDLSDVKEMCFEDSELETFSLKSGDVLICEGGYPGRAAVWDERESNIYFQKAIHRVRFQNKVDPNYFVYVLRESAESGRLSSYFTGAGIQHFTGKGLKSFLVPLPPLTEQKRIVVKIDGLMAICDSLKESLQEAQVTQVQLADAIVEQAVG